MVVGAMPRREAVTRSMIEIDGAAAGLLVGGDVFELRQLLQAGDEEGGPVVELVDVGIFEGVLVLRCG